jgi:hypothetical protein
MEGMHQRTPKCQWRNHTRAVEQSGEWKELRGGRVDRNELAKMTKGKISWPTGAEVTERARRAMP